MPLRSCVKDTAFQYREGCVPINGAYVPTIFVKDAETIMLLHLYILHSLEWTDLDGSTECPKFFWPFYKQQKTSKTRTETWSFLLVVEYIERWRKNKRRWIWHSSSETDMNGKRMSNQIGWRRNLEVPPVMQLRITLVAGANGSATSTL